MLDDLSVVVQPKNIDARPDVVAWPILPAVQNNVIAFGDHALELDALAGIVARSIFEIIDETLLAVGNIRGCAGCTRRRRSARSPRAAGIG
jgi:hypothetical protein